MAELVSDPHEWNIFIQPFKNALGAHDIELLGISSVSETTGSSKLTYGLAEQVRDELFNLLGELYSLNGNSIFEGTEVNEILTNPYALGLRVFDRVMKKQSLLPNKNRLFFFDRRKPTRRIVLGVEGIPEMVIVDKNGSILLYSKILVRRGSKAGYISEPSWFAGDLDDPKAVFNFEGKVGEWLTLTNFHNKPIQIITDADAKHVQGIIESATYITKIDEML
jgi:hypothetical protein